MHRKGWTEETKGQGAGRAVEDADFETMCDQLKGSGWEFSLSDKEEKQLDKGKFPAKLANKMKLEDNVRDSFAIDRVIVILVHSKLSHDIIFGRCKLVVHFLVLQLLNFVACECRFKLNDVMSYVLDNMFVDHYLFHTTVAFNQCMPSLAPLISVFLCHLFPVLGFSMIQITHCQCVCNH